MKKNMLIVMLVITFLFTSCGAQKTAEDDTRRGDLALMDSAELNDIELVSKRWKKYRKIEDFHYLKDNCLKPGVSSSLVLKLLGEPLHKSVYKSTHFWLYVKCDVSKNQYYAWSCLVDESGKLSSWKQKGIM